MKKKNLKEKLIYRKIKKPNVVLAFFVTKAFSFIAKKRNVSFHYDFDIKEYKKKQFILIAQHCSKDEYIYVLSGIKNYNLYTVVGYQNFFNKLIFPLLLRLGTIAKYLYQPDIMAVKQMLKVIKQGGNLVFFPEGIQSTSGSMHPINPATMKLLMKAKLPVILYTSNGSYLTRTRYSSDIKKGKIDAYFHLLYTKDDYDKYSEDVLYQRLLNKFKYNDLNYNKKARIPFVGKKPNIYGLDKIIYKCPCCNEEFKMKIIQDTIKCLSCDYQVKMNEYYDLLKVNKPLVFDDIDKWYKYQRKMVHNEVIKDDFYYHVNVKAFDININKLKNQLCEVGNGSLTISSHFLTYKGIYNNVEQTIVFDIKNLPSTPFTPSEGSFDMYYEDKYYCFAPIDNPLQVVKIMLIVEEIHNLYDPIWKKVSDEAYE
ncbi:MAG: 1-acyl-sn-glycerol-3-phosphate acyltransferase [Erysipelotrichaceae bacterium]|nr:1-acyl-sn-glycerol-3-phosphate acyltransferase [Erysipelotrichaceae bacterium]